MKQRKGPVESSEQRLVDMTKGDREEEGKKEEEVPPQSMDKEQNLCTLWSQ